MVSISSSLRLVFSVLLVACIHLSSQAQTSENTTFVGLGAGSIAFYGDVANKNHGISPSLGRLGYHLTLSNQFTPYLHGGLEAMFGTTGASERALDRNLNFYSEIRSGGLFAAYNFDHFLQDDRKISPFISLGISGFEFLSKTDLYDAEGREYHYWSDGTVRDIAQDASNSDESVLLVRDYDFESDLRELNIDGLGDYDEKGLAFPIGVGAQFELSPYLFLSVHTRYYLTNTDLIDNVSEESIGSRKGDGANDAFLYTGFNLRYGLHKKVERPDGPAGDLLANLTDRGDEDDDGVKDIVDRCPRTPAGVPVDVNGCPLDGDGDGVPDYADLEMDSAEGAYVDVDGVTLSDEEFQRRYNRFTSIGGEAKRIEGTVESADIPDFVFTPRPGKKYMVKVDETQEGITAEMASLLLSIPDVQTVTQGDTTVYLVGDYDNLPDAVRRKLSLEEQGMEGEVVSSENGVLTDEEKAARKIKRELEKDGFEPSANASEMGVFWRVQVGAFRYKMSSNIFAPLTDVVTIYGDDDLTRYFSGVYTERADAETYRDILQNSGYNDAFLAAFRDGERQNVSKAQANDNSASSDELWDRASPDAFDEGLIDYKIMLVESDGTIPTAKLEQLRELGSIEQVTTPGRTVYLTGKFDNKAAAESSLSEMQASGLEDAQVVGLFNGEIVTLEEIKAMLKN